MALVLRLALTILVGFALTLGMARPTLADDWQAPIYNEGLPKHLVAVDKNRQTFLFFEKKSPLKLRYSYPCTTGQLVGDKKELNDLRTPEGIYFVEYKIGSGLDFKEYGGIAYTLNYPNPVDRLRGKTGHGIWIHSKGFGIAPRSTRGCVAIGLKEIDEVGPQLTPGTAVVLAGTVDENSVPLADDGTARELRRLMQNWSHAWATRSRKMFDYYDGDAYSKAMTENFVAFRQNKERLFKILQFIKIFNREIHVLAGPGYWVTWSEQLYTASNLSTEGVRRLYWQRGQDKKFRIVGMEWTPRDLGMRADFQKGRLVAEALPAPVSDASSEAPALPRLDMPEAAPEAVAQAAPPPAAPAPAVPVSGAAVKETLLAASDPLVPRRGPAPPPAEINWGAKPALQEDAQPGPGSAAEQPPMPGEQAPGAAPYAVPAVPSPAVAQPAAPQALELSPAVRQSIVQNVRGWNDAVAARSTQVADFYDQARYNRLPNLPRGASYNTAQRELTQTFRALWLTLISRAPVLELQGDVVVSRCEQMLVTPGNSLQGVRSLYWSRGADGEFRIVASDFKPQELGLVVDYLDQVSATVSTELESWRKAWEAGRLDEYIAFYADDAVQQGRWGAKNLYRQKEALWAKVKPALVQLTGLRLVMDRAGIRADMTQVYADSAGRTDRGVKTLLMRFDGQTWRIQREDWLALPGVNNGGPGPAQGNAR